MPMRERPTMAASRVMIPKTKHSPAISSTRPTGMAKPVGRPTPTICRSVAATFNSLNMPELTKITAMNIRPSTAAIVDMVALP